MGPFTITETPYGAYITFRKDVDGMARQMYSEVASANCHIEGYVGLEIGVLCLNYMYEVRVFRCTCMKYGIEHV